MEPGGSLEPLTRSAWEWAATGTTWRVHHDGCVDHELACFLSAAVACDEARWSRFQPTSEVAQITAGAGRAVAVSPETVELIEASLLMVDETAGLFDPLVGGALQAWGYSKGLQHAVPHAASSPAPQVVRGRIEVDRGRGTVRIPAGAVLDLGGIGKGWMADRAARLVRDRVEGGRVLIDAGGDLVAARGDHLAVVEGTPRAVVALPEGAAIATSGWRRRSWVNGDGVSAHHLIDPETGVPGLRTTATVIAASGALADVQAKALALRPTRIASLSLPARVEVDGTVHRSPGWPEAGPFASGGSSPG